MKLASNNHKLAFAIDWKTFLPAILLSIIGVITLLSTCILPEGGYGDLSIVWKQLLFIGIGFTLYFIVSFLDLSYLKYWQVLLVIYAVTLVLLILTLLVGIKVNGARRWLVFGGFQLQPSEVAKVAIILGTASLFSMRGKFNELLVLLISAISTVVILFLTYLEPSGSITLLIFTIWFLVTFLALSNPLRNTILLLIMSLMAGGFLLASSTGNLLWLLLGLLSVFVVIFILYSKTNWKILSIIFLVIGVVLGLFLYKYQGTLLKDYQSNRIEAFLDQNDKSNFNVNQSKIAIGSGQIFGKGFGNGTQSKRNFLPEHQTDFIFASFAEEFGLVGCILVLGLYGFLILHCFMTAINTIHKPMVSLIAVGIGIKILLELFINLGTDTGTIPATGIPLPLMSAGGTITIMTLLCLGIIQNISINHGNVHRERSEEIIDVYEN